MGAAWADGGQLCGVQLSNIKLREVRFMLVFMLVFLALNDLLLSSCFDPNSGHDPLRHPHGAVPSFLAV